MAGDFSISTQSSTHPASASRSVDPRTAAKAAILQFFQPFVLAVLALAFAVGANGYGHKLEQYFQHAELAKATATRMWVDHRDHSALAAPIHQRAQLLSASELFLVFAPHVPRLARDHALTTPPPARAAIIVSSHIPLRAPPALQSSLA